MASPFTSEWEWLSINRGLDYTVVNNAKLQRNNWTLTRSRSSDEVYVSELGEVELELSAFNGGVTETVTGVTTATITGMRFSTTRDWTLNTVTWVETGRIVNSRVTYRMESGATNIPNASKTNVVFYGSNDVYAATGDQRWMCVEADTVDVDNLTWGTTLSSYSNHTVSQAESPVSINSVNFEIDGGTFHGESRAFTGTWPVTGSFLCTGDNQVYDQKSVDWFKQVQTWSFKDSWVTAP
jgi:hypothetical protein